MSHTADDSLLGYGRDFSLALLLHLGLVALMIIGTWNLPRQRDQKPIGLEIEATLFDARAFEEKQQAAADAADRARRQQERAEALRQQREREDQARQAREAQEAEAEARRQQVEREAAREQERQAQLEQQRQAEAEQRRQEAELQRRRDEAAEQRRLQQEKLEREAAELERIRQERLAQERAIAEQQQALRELEEQRRQQALAEEQARMAELMAEEEAAAAAAGRRASQTETYMAAIQAAVTANWLRPPTAQAGLVCLLRVTQIPGGTVVSATVVDRRCNADAATKRSIEAAVTRSGTLPYRGFEDVFEREIDFTFRYEGN